MNAPSRHQRNFLLIALVCPLVVLLSLFLGHGWQHPGALFTPEQRGILEIRFWRVLTGAVVGGSLALAGVALQAILRNPLADPYVLGTSSGAGLGAALCIHLGGLGLGLAALPLSSFAGAALSLLAVYLLARVDWQTSPHTLVLAGVAWSALCGSLLMFLVARSSAEGIHAITWWFLGDLQAHNASLVILVAAGNSVALLGLLGMARAMNVLMLGDEAAHHVGLAPEPTKAALLLLGAFLAATSVSLSGLISFVGLIVPHSARALVGAEHRRLLPAALLVGAAFLTLADGLGRLFFYPQELPVGILTAVVGAPFFLALLRRSRRALWIS